MNLTLARSAVFLLQSAVLCFIALQPVLYRALHLQVCALVHFQVHLFQLNVTKIQNIYSDISSSNIDF